MSYPSRQVVGSIYDGGGNVVTVGRIDAELIPSGTVVSDVATPSVVYKLGGEIVSGLIDANRFSTTGVQSFFVTALESATPTDAYYRVRYMLFTPTKQVWFELWRVTGINSGPLPIGEIVPTAYGPSIDSGYAPIQFIVGGGGTGTGDVVIVTGTTLPTADANTYFGTSKTIYVIQDGNNPSEAFVTMVSSLVYSWESIAFGTGL